MSENTMELSKLELYLTFAFHVPDPRFSLRKALTDMAT